MSGGFSTETLTGSATVRVQRTRILSELLDHLADLADTAVQTMRAEIPAYAAQDENFLADVRDQVVRHYRSKLAVMLEDRTVTARRHRLRPPGRHAAGQGRARPGRLHQRLPRGQQVFWGSVLERAGHSAAGHEAALSLAAPIMRYCDFASTHAANAYMEFQQLRRGGGRTTRAGTCWRPCWPADAPTRGGQLAAAQAYGLGSDTRSPLLVVIAVLLGPRALVTGGNPVTTGPDRGVDARHAACAAISRAGANGTRTLSVVRQSEIVAIPALGPGGDPEELCDRLQAVRESLMGEGIVLAMGISTVVAGTAGIPQAYDEARTVLEFLPEDGGVAALPRLSPFQYLALRADDTARHLVDPRITALLSEDRARGGVLTATIRAFAAADLNLRASAERLQIHPNTAQYRLRRIQERTGRSLRRISDLLDLLVAIALHDSLPANAISCSPPNSRPTPTTGGKDWPPRPMSDVGARTYGRSMNLADRLHTAADRLGGRTVVTLDDEALTYGALDLMSARVAALLRRRGIGAGDRVAVMLPNVPEFAVVYYGVLRIGAVVVPLDPLLRRREIAAYVGDCGACLLIAWHAFAETAEAGTAGTLTDCFFVVPGEFQRLLRGLTAEPDVTPRADGETAVIHYTSGTTGRAKGVELTHGNLGGNAAAVARCTPSGWTTSCSGRCRSTTPSGRPARSTPPSRPGRASRCCRASRRAGRWRSSGGTASRSSRACRPCTSRCSTIRAPPTCRCCASWSPAGRRSRSTCCGRTRGGSAARSWRATGSARPRPSPRPTGAATAPGRGRSAARSRTSR